MSAAVLYSPQVLALATGLAAWPWNDALPLEGSARSKSCGSALTLGLSIDAAGRIEQLGLRTQACAIGQAAAAIFAAAAPGRNRQEIHAADAAIAAWLLGQTGLPDWPGLAAIATAREYPARHGAIRLAWLAARDALP